MKILLVETSDIGAAYTAEAVISMGYEPIFLCNLKEYGGDPLTQIKSYRHYDCDTSSKESILAKIEEHKLDSIAAVISLADIRLQIALDVSQELRVSGLDPAVAKLKDKTWVSNLIPEFSPSSFSFKTAEIPYIELESLFQGGESRVIVKPVSGAGGFAVFFLDSVEDLPGLAEKLNATAVPACMGQGDWIAQTVAKGELVSVEGFAAKGKIRILGISNRRKIGSTESGACFPIDDSLMIQARHTASRACEALLNRSGFTRGYFHIEFMVHGEDAWMIDANVGRVGGGAIAEQLAISYGCKPREVFRHLLDITLFPEVDTVDPYQRRAQPTLAVLYGIDHADRLLRVRMPSGLPGYHTQVLGNGSPVSAMGTNDWAWIGILSGLKDDVEMNINRISIQTEKGEFAPSY